MTLQRWLDVSVIGGVAVQDTVLRNQTTRAFGEKYFVAKLDWFFYLPSLDQIGVGFKDRIDLLVVWNLLSLKHAAAGLVDDAVAELAVVIDLASKLADDNVVHQVEAALVFGLFEHPSGVLYDLFRNPNQLAILSLLPVAFLRCHPLDLLHPAPCRACAVGKSLDPFWENLSETTDEPGDDPHDVPEQGAIGWMVDVGFGNRRIDAQSLAVLQSEIDRSFYDQIIDGLKCRGSQFVKSPIESVVLRGALTVETRELTQCVAVGNPRSRSSR